MKRWGKLAQSLDNNLDSYSGRILFIFFWLWLKTPALFIVVAFDTFKHNALSQGKARQGKARQGKARQGKARQGKARQGKARQGKARQGKARQDFV